MNHQAEASRLEIATPARVLRKLWGAAATVLSILYTIVLAPFAALTAPLNDGHPVSHIGRLWARMILWTCGVRVEITGLDHLQSAGPWIFVSNHQSFFDIFAAIAWLPCEVRFIAKKELMRIPLIGYAMRRANHIVIDRQAGGQSIRRALEVSRMGYSIYVFAEGHRFSDNRVHEFSDGAAWLAIHTKLPCVPVAVSGTSRFMPRGARLVAPGGRMRIAIGEPIATGDLKSADRAGLTRQLEAAVRNTFVTEL